MNMNQILRIALRQIAPMIAVGIGVLLATKPDITWQSTAPQAATPIPRPATQEVAPSQSAKPIEATPLYVVELRAQIQALKNEIATLKDQPVPMTPQPGDDHLPMQPTQPDSEADPNALTQRMLAARQHAQDEKEQFVHQYSAAASDPDWTQRLQTSIGGLESEIVDTQFSDMTVTDLECRAVGCEIRVNAKDVPADIVSLMLEAQLGGEGYIQNVITEDEGRLRVMVARRS